MFSPSIRRCYRGPYEDVVIVAAWSIAQWPSLGACDPDYFSPDRRSYNPRTRPILRYWKARSADYTADCATRSAAQTALLGHLTTAEMARDMDNIRRARGRAQITYYGVSAGTYLGQVYATPAPARR